MSIYCTNKKIYNNNVIIKFNEEQDMDWDMGYGIGIGTGYEIGYGFFSDMGFKI